jgi:anti-sigma factor RsiW
MSHQPFETWLFSDETLTEEQQNKLDSHLETCHQCRARSKAWDGIQNVITADEPPAPAPGFAQRWQSRLAVAQQRRQTRKMVMIALGLFGLATVIFLTLAILNVLSTSYIYAISQFIAQFSLFAARLNQAWNFIGSMTDSFPILIPLVIVFGVGAIATLILLTTTWFGSLARIYRPTERGGLSK